MFLFFSEWLLPSTYVDCMYRASQIVKGFLIDSWMCIMVLSMHKSQLWSLRKVVSFWGGFAPKLPPGLCPWIPLGDCSSPPWKNNPAMSLSTSTDVSVRRTLPACGLRDQNPSTIGADHVTAGPPYMAVDSRRPSFSCRRCPHLEWPAAPRHVRIISACFPKPSEDAPLLSFFAVIFVQCLRSDFWQSNHSFYLFTYLLTYILETVATL